MNSILRRCFFQGSHLALPTNQINKHLPEARPLMTLQLSVNQLSESDAPIDTHYLGPNNLPGMGSNTVYLNTSQKYLYLILAAC